jgi:transposase-like protein
MADKIPVRFTNADAARKYLEKLLWPEGPVCPHCGVLNDATALKGKSTRPGVYWCNACQAPFSVTVGTVYERSKVPLNAWLYATHLLCSSKKGISSHQLARMLGVTYKTAWFMTHRIRESMTPTEGSTPIGGDGKTVEADEMFIGNKAGKRKAKGSGDYAHKRAILTLVERGGAVRSFHIDGATRSEIRPALDETIRSKTRVFTDGTQMYRFMPRALHETVDHSKGEYVRGDAHTNTVEGVFSIFRRGMVGTYQHCSEAHLHRYLAEFDFRYSNRAKLGINDGMRAEIALKGIEGKRLTYRRIVQV